MRRYGSLIKITPSVVNERIKKEENDALFQNFLLFSLSNVGYR